MLLEIIPLGESREIQCGPANFTRVIDMLPNTLYVFTCIQGNLEIDLGAFLCGNNIPAVISVERLQPGVKVILTCGVF
ncbi:hypothetical protein [Bacillus cereus]|uniref:Uncharacterized protein n=1 Tax=Bacillus cereus TaxID=1396 RepID=A0A2B9EDN4_BACCE|nr:hypothetical protein [Bacillus cereus]PGM97973.1 hypothetical protein CN958_01605 [Bacillus cereus]